MKNIKHKHGSPNVIIQTEEKTMLAVVDRALVSSGNSQTIGRNGEIPLLSFLDRHLPNTLMARTGHLVSPDGSLSPQIDIMILDSRYPLLSENNDKSVLAMLHSVVACIEVKTNIATKDLNKMWKNSKNIRSLAKKVFGDNDSFGNLYCYGFAYCCKQRLDTFADEFFDIFSDVTGYTNLFLLRLSEKDKLHVENVGALLHLEPDIVDDKSSEVVGYIPTLIHEHTPLSDFYYMLVQDSYYCLEHRNYSIGDIGNHFNEYMSWSTVLKSEPNN